MNDLQSKVGGGLNKIQDSLQVGKQKLQVVQEISQQRKIARENLEKRGEILLQLGEMTYKQLRAGEWNVEELNQLGSAITQYDIAIHQAEKMVNKLSKAERNNQSCGGCGSDVSEGDRFCGSCGQSVEVVAVQEVIETMECRNCEQNIPKESQFCSCCGIKN